MVCFRSWANDSLLVDIPMDLIGGAEGNRTPDLLNAIQALSQLSYGPGAEPVL